MPIEPAKLKLSEASKVCGISVDTQPVRKPPWLTAHLSNLADLMEGGSPSGALPVQLRGLSCPAAIFAHDSC